MYSLYRGRVALAPARARAIVQISAPPPPKEIQRKLGTSAAPRAENRGAVSDDVAWGLDLILLDDIERDMNRHYFSKSSTRQCTTQPDDDDAASPQGDRPADTTSSASSAHYPAPQLLSPPESAAEDLQWFVHRARPHGVGRCKLDPGLKRRLVSNLQPNEEKLAFNLNWFF